MKHLLSSHRQLPFCNFLTIKLSWKTSFSKIVFPHRRTASHPWDTNQNSKTWLMLRVWKLSCNIFVLLAGTSQNDSLRPKHRLTTISLPASQPKQNQTKIFSWNPERIAAKSNLNLGYLRLFNLETPPLEKTPTSPNKNLTTKQRVPLPKWQICKNLSPSQRTSFQPFAMRYSSDKPSWDWSLPNRI